MKPLFQQRHYAHSVSTTQDLNRRITTMYQAKEEEANRPTCWQCELPGTIKNPLSRWLNVDNAYEPFHEDCLEQFIDAQPVNITSDSPDGATLGWIGRKGA